MNLKIGIVGLPNVGKSTLFNALTKQKAAQAANYPFCTIDPNVGVIEVPDHRLDRLQSIFSSEKKIPAVVEFVDIAGLVEGASQGEGLGNQFLSHIRECNAIAQMVRVFENDDITHVCGAIDPQRDREIIESELLLADLQTVEKRLAKLTAQSKSGDKSLLAAKDVVAALQTHLAEGKHAIHFEYDDSVAAEIRSLHLLTNKPFIYIVNLDETSIGAADIDAIRNQLGVSPEIEIIPVCAKMEEELIDFDITEAQELLESAGVSESGLHQLIRRSYDLLGLQTYFTAGPKEARAWTINKGDSAPQAAGVIHTDFEKGFIKAEVIAFDHIDSHGGEQQAKEKGLLRTEGKEYIVQDGDVMHFRFNN